MVIILSEFGIWLIALSETFIERTIDTLENYFHDIQSKNNPQFLIEVNKRIDPRASTRSMFLRIICEVLVFICL